MAAAAGREPVTRARRLVVKLGTSVLTGGPTAKGAGLDLPYFARLASQVQALAASGRETVIVSSAAIACGMHVLGLKERPRAIPMKQACAAVGQSGLMRAYEEAFAPHGRRVGQILLAADDLASRRRFLNARNTLRALLDAGVVPVVNENDTVTVDEIRFGDNDTLSALVTNVVEADLLVILSDIDGLYDADPRKEPTARLLPEIREVDDALRAKAGGAGALGSGGMATKLEAARKAALFGVPTIIANGRTDDVLVRVVAGEPLGTFFRPREERLASRKHWIAFGLTPSGTLTLDDGAVAAIVRKGKSLLPSGVIAVSGRFEAGDSVRLVDASGREVARGLVNYPAHDVEKILRAKTTEIEARLGYKSLDEVVHRDDLVVL
ncbi:MAG TPA: glutamate 5-kinase [Thermodesulfobacteriota bacterium]